MTANLIAAMLIGFGSSAHCIFMCGGIAASIGGSDPSRYAPQWLTLAFHLGRLCSYALIGFLFGLLLQSASGMLGVGAWLRIFAGLMLIAMGLYLANIWRGLTYVERLMEPVWRPISTRLKRHVPARSMSDALIVGLFWGWLPCGLVYSTLIWASSSGSATESALLMFAMGVGTLPVLLGISFFGGLLRKKATAKIGGLVLCLFGIWTLVMPLSSIFGANSHGAHDTGPTNHEQHMPHDMQMPSHSDPGPGAHQN